MYILHFMFLGMCLGTVILLIFDALTRLQSITAGVIIGSYVIYTIIKDVKRLS